MILSPTQHHCYSHVLEPDTCILSSLHKQQAQSWIRQFCEFVFVCVEPRFQNLAWQTKIRTPFFSHVQQNYRWRRRKNTRKNTQLNTNGGNMDQKVSGHHTSTLTTFPQTKTKTSQTQTPPKSRRKEEPKKRRRRAEEAATWHRGTEEEEERRRKKKKKKNIYIHNNKYGTGK